MRRFVVYIAVGVAALFTRPSAGQEAVGRTVPSGEIRITADAMRQAAGSEFRAEGHVSVAVGHIRIQADRVDLRETKDAEEQLVREIVAEGNVVLQCGEERLTLKRLVLTHP